MNASWSGSMRSEIFLQIKFITLQGCPTKKAAFLPRQPTPYSQLIIQAVLIVPKCYLA